MIRLFAENPGQANPNLALRWCVDKKTLDELKEKGIKNPQLLLVVAQHLDKWNVREIERKLVPLGQAMEWLEFNRPGRHTIYATIVWDVWGDDKGFEFLTQWLLRGSRSGVFTYEMFNGDGVFSRIRHSVVGKHSLDEGSLDVVVAEEFFAKEPPAWLNWWVNLWFGAMEISRPTNQCSFRRRAILAFTIQPIPVFIWALLKSLMRLAMAVVLVLCGMRRVSFKPIIHPFDLCLGNVWRDMGPSVFLKDRYGKWYFAYVAGLIGCGLRTIWRALVSSPSAEELERRWKRKEQEIAESDRKKREKKEREREQRESEKFYEGLQDVACIGVPLKPKLELLPKRRKTVYLRFQDLKAKVCRPYAR